MNRDLLEDAHCQAESAEGRIVLRQTDDGKSTTELLYSRRRLRVAKIGAAQGAAGRGAQNSEQLDTGSSTASTSEVDSEDDAASIVSRLSQIVVEQEEKLTGAGELPNNPGAARSASNWHSSERAPAGNTLQPLAAGLRHVSSASRLALRRQRGSQQQEDTCGGSADALGNVRPASWTPGNQLPEIQVERHEEEPQRTSQFVADTVPINVPTAGPTVSLRLRAQSVVDVHLVKQGLSRATLRRNGSSGCFAPERGTLQRRCESQEPIEVRNQGPAPPRQRSNTAGSGIKNDLLDESESLDQRKRSTWTLSDFDQTFKGSSDKLNSGNQLNKNSPETIQQANSGKKTATAQSPIDLGADGNTLSMINAIKLSADSGEAGGANRRSSRSYSLASIASSCNGSARANANKQKQQSTPGEPTSLLRACLNADRLRQCLPIAAWLPAYNLSLLWGDLIAGMAVAVLNISTSMSAAVVAGTDFGVAFRASIVNTLVYASLCSSRHTSFGSWSIMSQMLLVSVRRALSDELILARFNMGPTTVWDPEEYERWRLNIIIMYTFLIGLIQLVCGLLNLGNIVASFIPEALCSSLITATAFTMAVGQLAHMSGTSNKILFSIERNTTELLADLKNPPVDITDLFAGLFRWAQQLALLIKYSQLINLVCLLISLVSVVLLAVNQYVIQKQLERHFKRKIFIPSEMILLIIMIVVSKLMGLKENYNVATCGPIEINFDIPALPDLMLVRELWFESVATALISYTMVYVMAKSYSNKLNYEVDCNQELIACGAGNLVGGLFDALPATASFSRTAGQVEAGGQTQMASIINCVLLVVLAQLLGQHVAELPICVMAATLFYGFARMMTRLPEVLTYWRVCKVDFAIWMVTFIAILTLDIVNGFVYGFIFSIFTMLYRAQNRRCYLLGSIGSADVYVPLVKYPLAQEIEGVCIFQFCGPIHYVCADLFERLLRLKISVDVKQILQNMAEQETAKFRPRHLALPSHIILDFSMISYIDSAGIRVIKKIIEDYQRVNITILLASLASHVATVVKREPSLWEVHKDRFYVTLADAVHCALRDCRRQSRDHSVKVIAA